VRTPGSFKMGTGHGVQAGRSRVEIFGLAVTSGGDALRLRSQLFH
jgi:hypothetical protein